MAEVAILGAGAGGCTAAADLTLRGHRVRLFNRSPEKIEAVRSNGGVEVFGAIAGFAPIDKISFTIPDALEGAEVVLIFTPANAQGPLMEAAAPYLRGGQVIIFAPGAAGSLEASAILKRRGKIEDVTLIECSSLPYACRMAGLGRVKVHCRLRLRAAAFPAKRTDKAISELQGLYPMKPAANVLDTALSNPNFLIHPAPTILNFGEIERSGWRFPFYGRGMTASALRLIEVLDGERKKICTELGLQTISLDEIYDEFGTGPIYRDSVQARETEVTDIAYAEERFLDEDVPYGLVFLESLGNSLRIATPLTRAIIDLASALRGIDFRRAGRTVESLGLAGMDARRMAQYLWSGQ